MEVSEAKNIVANSHAGDMTYWQQAAQVLINDLRRRVANLESAVEATEVQALASEGLVWLRETGYGSRP